MNALASYSFLPWLRQGIANTIASADGDPDVRTRATIPVTLEIDGDPVGGGAEQTAQVAQNIALFGPGDIIGIDSRAIFRTDPHPWITNYESNYLAAVEFYDEDFPWRYTPAAPDGVRLRPWITLLVLRESEFDEGQNALGRPLSYITVKDTRFLPPPDELWAWAHVHFNQSLAGSEGELISPDMGAVLPRVQAVIQSNPDLAYGRIVCPRRLDDNAAYHAFVVPTFETGRLAGLGHDPTGAPFATASAWGLAGQPEPGSLPVYFRWYFRTGSKGDFEYLVSLLKPQPIDTRVGTRDMDVQEPGSNIPGITDPALGGVLRLGGALRVPDADLGTADLQLRQKYDNWDQPYPHPFQVKLAAFINLPDDYAAQAAGAANAASGIAGIAGNPDPLITAPLYGRWHALTQRLLTKRDGSAAANETNWVHTLNLDPRFRVAAAFGAQVVEENAEEYMNYAWQQIGDVLAANQKIRHLQLATQVSGRWYDFHLAPLANANQERAFLISAPVAARVLVGAGTLAAAQAASLGSPAPTAMRTIAFMQSASLVSPALTSTAMRRVTRPRARLVRLLPFTADVTPNNLLTRVNAGAVSPAPPRTLPPALPTVNQAAGAARPHGVPGAILNALARYPWLPYALLLVALLLALLLFVLLPAPAGLVAAVAAAGALVAFAFMLLRWQRADAPAQTIGEANQTPASVDTLPHSPDFVLVDPGSTFRPATGATDSPTAVRFKNALRDWYTLRAGSNAAAARPPLVPFDLAGMTGALIAALDPRVAIPRRGLAQIAVPPWIRALIGETFDEVMAYPKIDLPMYEPLKKKSIELFLPNINLVAPNSITLIETNQKFIEAYMVGLNYEFGRKLLGRGYPTDQRGAYFRQYWDVRSFIDSEGLSHDALKEKLYDIPELHRWARGSNLGDHNNRASPGRVGEQVVLVIRGELLKKYPTAVIYAQHAKWARTGGTIDPDKPRLLDELVPGEEQNPPRGKIRSPLYEAKADPDIYFFGFDLTVAQAKGGAGENPTDDPGWFFVIKERPGEPRFGLELARADPFQVFDQLTWDDAGTNPGEFLAAGSLASVTLPTVTDPDDPELAQNADDRIVNGAPVSSARWAYLLFRAPIMVAVHADEMLA
jgi:hypothetical protein